jgi:acyl-CoA reductase-like NAD-dependent aldehyde dehydrogenase
VRLGEIAREVLPPGVLNVVTGDGSAGNALVRHPRVKRLSFIGSVRTGMAIQRSAAEVAVKSISWNSAARTRSSSSPTRRWTRWLPPPWPA